MLLFFFFSSRRRHTRLQGDWSSDVCSSDLQETHRYLIAVQRDSRGRGGSRAMHELVHPGAVLTTSPPRNDFPLLHARGYEIGRASCRERVWGSAGGVTWREKRNTWWRTRSV